MPVHAIDHSISRKDGVNHNMLVLLNNFWIRLLENVICPIAGFRDTGAIGSHSKIIADP